MIITHGADVNAPVAENPPLHVAALHGSAEMVPLLVANGAKIEGMDGGGYTPLQVSAHGGRVAVTRALLAAGAKIGTRYDYNGWSALDMAAVEGHAEVVTAMIEHCADVNKAAGIDGCAPHRAAQEKKPAVIDVLVQAGADTEQEDGDGERPLYVAAHNPRIFLGAQESPVAAVLVLLKHGTGVSKQNTAGETPLYCAAEYAGMLRTAEVVDLLLRRGADEKAVDSDGQTPAGVVGSEFYEWMGKLVEDVERVRQLLANAPADRAWRRRGFLVLCRAHYPSGRVQGPGSSHAHDIGIAKRTRSRAGPSRTEIEWAGVASMLVGVGADPISLMGGGADIIFETIVGYL